MWLTLSANQGYLAAAANRADAAMLLTSAELAQAERAAREWKPRTPQ